MRSLVVFIVLVLASLALSKLTIHVVPHSHCDAGWLITYDNYFDTQVKYILNTVTDSLYNDPSLRFVWVEQIFFQKWWRTVATAEQQDKFRTILKRGQLEFLNGGWVMHDDAVTTYSAMIDQTTLGHQFISDVFGEEYLPKSGWSIDPFGYSSVTAKINKGFMEDYHVLVRVSYEIKDQLRNDKALDYWWRFDPAHDDADHQIFTHIMYAHYGSISGFNWDYGDAPVTDKNVAGLSQLLVQSVIRYSQSYLTDHIMFPFGNDFTYQNATVNFSNMSKIFDYVRKNYPDITIQYSKVSDYFNAVTQSKHGVEAPQYPARAGDFFPYADNIEAFWTGYFSSRAEIKDRARQTERYMRAFDSLFSLARIAGKNLTYNDNYEGLFSLRFANGLVQHHDGITGTEKPFVEENYLLYLNNGVVTASNVASKALLSLLAKKPVDTSKVRLLLTESVSYMTQLAKGDFVPLVLYNSLGWDRQGLASVIVNTPNVVVQTSTGATVPFQVAPWEDNSFIVTFTTSSNIPALGVTVVFLKVVNSATQVVTPKETTSISNSVYTAEFTDGSLTRLINKRDGLSINFKPEFLAYESYPGPGQASGAYIFRSNGPEALPVDTTGRSEAKFLDGDVASEVRQDINRYIKQTTRLYKTEGSDSHFIEFDLQVGPVPGNKEVVIRFNTDIKNGRKIITDNNGLNLWERTYRDWPNDPSKNLFPTSSNFYPFVYQAAISDNEQQLTVLTNSSRAVASLKDGAIEVMIQRQTLQDDGRGVGVPMNDTNVVTLRLRVVLSTKENKYHAQLAHITNYPIEVFAFEKKFTGNFTDTYATSYSAVSGALPDRVHLLTLQQQSVRGKEFTLLRTANLNQYGQAATVPLDHWFNDVTVKAYGESSLDGLRAQQSTDPWVAHLDPLQIRSFIAQFNKK